MYKVTYRVDVCGSENFSIIFKGLSYKASKETTFLSKIKPSIPYCLKLPD